MLKKSQDNIERHNFMLPVRVILAFHPQFFLTLKKKEKSQEKNLSFLDRKIDFSEV